MNAIPPDAMLEATRLTRAGRLTEASALLQAALGRPVPPVSALAAVKLLRVLDVDPDTGEIGRPASACGTATMPRIASAFHGFHHRIGQREPAPVARPPTKDEEFLHGRFSSAGASRDYRLFRPAGLRSGNAPLVVMLHGCTQSP